MRARHRPPRAEGSSRRLVGILLARAVEADAEEHQQRDADHHRHDEHVGDVVDRRHHPRRVDEVDDVADREAGVADEPVGEVPEDSAEEQPQHDRPQRERTRDREDDDDRRRGETIVKIQVTFAERERGAGVACQIQLQHVAPDRHGLLERQVLQGEVLRELVDGQHQHREDRDEDAGRRRSSRFRSATGLRSRDGRARGRAGDVEVAELLLDEAAQLRAVVALELAQLADAGLERRALGVEARDLVAALGLGLGEDRGGLGLCVGDELVALGLALGDVLVVQALGELDDAGRRGDAAGCGAARPRGRDLSTTASTATPRRPLASARRARTRTRARRRAPSAPRSRRSSCATRRRSRRGSRRPRPGRNPP
jgi:hypothetical protein